MTVNVYPLTHHFGNLISHNISIAAFISSCDHTKHPHAYADTKFSDLGNVNMIEAENPCSDPSLFTTNKYLHRSSQYSTTNSAKTSSLEPTPSPPITTRAIQMRPSSNLCAS